MLRYSLVGTLLHTVNGPEEIDGRGPSHRERCGGSFQILPSFGGEHEPVRPGHADRRCAANRELADRAHELGNRPALELNFLLRQPALVEEDDLRAVLLVPNDVVGV